MQIEIDPETVDRLVCCTLLESINSLKESINTLKRKKKLEDYQKQDLADCVRTLAAHEEVYDYFGGNVK